MGVEKSAILTAIQFCLGAKASATNRATKIKDLIRAGEDKAEVIIHLSNKGLDHYQKDIFGDTIIIERSIHSNAKSGTTSYKIKNSSDKVISTKASDLKLILEKFNIQVDNPCALMSQDTSKNF